MSIYFAVLSSEIGAVIWLRAGRSQDRCQSARRGKIFFFTTKMSGPLWGSPCIVFIIYRDLFLPGVNVPANETCYSASSTAEAKKPNFKFSGPCIVIYLCNKDQQDAVF
jgi:hypothetical protein